MTMQIDHFETTGYMHYKIEMLNRVGRGKGQQQLSVWDSRSV
jgi:hypothetical protein